MERYKVSWLQSASHKAALQSVVASINGQPEATLLNEAAMNVSSHEHSFPTGASVRVYIRTYNEAKSEFADSLPLTFTALDLSPVTPASGLAAVWVGHE